MPNGNDDSRNTDAVVNLLMTKVAQRGLFEDVINAGTAQDRQDIENSLERHATDQRAQGRAGW
ncbi:hypothetical protein [Micromonospora zamorensis]|uniref:hypothetical protein n=1 Tax=Micromonospora zamorensis TaxID=709883 RepID=UPI003CF752AE